MIGIALFALQANGIEDVLSFKISFIKFLKSMVMMHELDATY